MKFLINIVELAIIAKVLWKTIRFFSSKKRRGKSVIGKTIWIIQRKAHKRLDRIINKQKEMELVEKAPNVIQFRKVN